MSLKSSLALSFFLPALAFGVLRAAAVESGAPGMKPAAVLSIMERVADWQLAHPSPHSPTDWTYGAYDAGVMALAGISENPRFVEAMVKMGEANAWKLGPRSYHADDHCVGQTYAELFLLRRDPRIIAPMRAQFAWILAHPTDGSLDFDPKRNPTAGDRWSWCDSLFMAPPAWIRLYAATGEKAFLGFMEAKWWITSDFLYDKEEHLFFRDSTYFARREANGKKIFWSRGNGWVLAGLARVLQYLPDGDPSRPRFVEQYRQMSDRILACQQTDGLWRSSLLDPENYPLQETSGTGFYCFALAWGVNHGLLDRSRFEPAVVRAWAGLVECVAPDGRLTHVQPIGADPKKFAPDATELYGVGAFLLAGSEIYRLFSPRP